MAAQPNNSPLWQPERGAFGGKGYLDLSPSKPKPVIGKITILLIGFAAVSALLGVAAQGVGAFLIVGLCALPFYYRGQIMARLKASLTPKSVGSYFLPGFLSFAALLFASGLSSGFFTNGFDQRSGFASALWLIGAAFVAVVVVKTWRWAIASMKDGETGTLIRETLAEFPNAKGWATTGEIAARFKLPHGVNYTEKDMVGIHIGNGIHWNELGHILTVGGAGQGKGVGLVLPVLLSDGLVRAGISVVCLDPKGENAAVAAPHLKRAGYDVHIINPFDIREVAHLGNSRWNPFDLIEPGQVKKFCDLLAFSLHNRRSNGDNDFFNNRCRQYISLYMRYALHVNKDSDIANDMPLFAQLRFLLRLSGEQREKLLANMAGNVTFTGRAEAEAILSRVMSPSVKTEDSIYSTIEEAINILDDENLIDSLSRSDFDLRQIAQKPVAIFICVRHDELRYYSAWLRMFTDALLKTLNRHYNPARKVLVLLDEFAQMGYVDQFAHAPAILRGFNVTLWPIVQHIGQLQDLYGREAFETFVGNSVVKHWFGGNGGSIDNTTAQYVAQRLPKVVNIKYDKQSGRPLGYERPLLDVQGVINYPKIIGEVLGLTAPFEIEKVPYWKWKFSMNNASENPYHRQ